MMSVSVFYHFFFQPVGTIIGSWTLNATDPDAGDTVKYQVAGAYTSNNNRYFDVVGDQLVLLNEIDLGLATDTDYTVNVEAVDQGGLKCDITITVHVVDVNQPHEITNLPRVVDLNSQTYVTGDTVRGEMRKRKKRM